MTPIKAFASAREWARWLELNGGRAAGVWLRFFKKDSGVASIKHVEALDEALCYGWIDGRIKKYDEKSWIHKFTPRRAKSLWSKRNREHAVRLIAAKRMKPLGLAEIEAAKADGRWKRAYDSGRTMTVPADFAAALSKNRKAKAFFASLNKTNRYSIAWRLQTAKTPQTRARRLRTILEMMRKGEKFH